MNRITKKRFISLLLALIMLISIFVVPMAAFAENGSDTAGNFDEFIVNLKDLEKYADSYARNHAEDAVGLVINYIRTGIEKYNDGTWGVLAGAENTAFTAYVAAQDEKCGTNAKNLRGIGEFVIPNGQTVEFAHMFASLSMAYYNKFAAANADFGSWAGDICDLMEYSKKHGVDASDVESMVSEINSKYFKYDDPDESSFGILDIYGDLDSYYIMMQLKNGGKKLSSVMSNYFTKYLTDENRATFFVSNRFSGCISKEAIRNAVYNIYKSNSSTTVLEESRGLSKDSDLRIACCYVFADYLYDLAKDKIGEQSNDYYSVYSSSRTTLAPGITQDKKFAYTKDEKRIAYYIATADIGREDVNIYANYNNNECTGWAMSRVTDQMAAAQARHSNPNDPQNYIENYNTIVGVNADFYDMTSGRPSGALVMEGVTYNGANSENFFAILKDGTPVIGSASEWALYSENVQEAVGGSIYLVKDGKSVVGSSGDYYNSRASRTCVGITADNRVVLMALDGRQEPISAGGSAQEIAQIMLDAGCVVAINLDGGGSTTYAAKEEGCDQVAVVNNPSDGYERSVSSSLLVVSTAKTSDEFDHAIISTKADYFTVGTSLEVTLSGVSSSGNAANIPEGAILRVSDDSVAKIDGNTVTAIETGDVDLELYLENKLVGHRTLHVVVPDGLSFEKETLNVIYGVPTELPLKATYKGNAVCINAGDVVIVADPETSCDPDKLNELIFDAKEESGIRNAVVAAMLLSDDDGYSYCEIKVSIYKSDEAVFDFEKATGGDRMFAWNREVSNSTTKDDKYYRVVDPNKDMDVSYTFAMDMREIPIPDKIEPMIELLPGGKEEGVTAWDFLLQLAERVSVLTEVRIKLKIDPEFDVDYSEMTIVNEYFRMTSADYNKDDHTLTIVCNWNKQSKPIDPVTANPICVLSGIKLTPKEGAKWDDKDCLNVINSGNISYDIYLRSSNVYSIASDPEYQEKYDLYPFINPNDETEKGARFGAEYISFEDKFTLDKSRLEGWVLSDDNCSYYYVNNVPVTGIKKVPGYNDEGHYYYYSFDENGVCQGKVSGLFEQDGDVFYAVNGELKTGWCPIENASGGTDNYYFDPKSGKAVDGNQKIGGYNYVFANHILVRGDLIRDNEGTRYMWAGSWASQKWMTIDGQKYYFRSSYYAATGAYAFHIQNKNVFYIFDDNGVWQENFSGFYEDKVKGKTRLVENGIVVDYPGLVFVDGYYYYFTYDDSHGTMVKNGKYWVDKTNGLMKEGNYIFDKDGRMLNPPEHKHTEVIDAAVEPTCTEPGKTEGKHCSACGAVIVAQTEIPAKGHKEEIRGVVDATLTEDGYTGDKYCSVCNKLLEKGKKIPKTGAKVTWIVDGKKTEEIYEKGVTPSYKGTTEKLGDAYYHYEFAGWSPEIKTVDGDATYTAIFNRVGNTGWVNEADGRTYIVNGEKAYCAQWATVESKEYYFDNSGYIVTGIQKLTKDGLEARYVFDMNGVFQSNVNGVYSVGNDTYWLNSGIIEEEAGLKRVVKENGEVNYYYFVTSADKEANKDKDLDFTPSKAVKGNKVDFWITKTNGLSLPEWGYFFDENGVILHDEDTGKNGILNENDGKYYYVDGIKAPAGMIKVGNDYYYVRSNGQLVVNRSYYCSNNHGLMADGTYTFDEEGRLKIEIPKNGIVSENDSLYYYKDGKLDYAGLIEINGSYYYVRTSGEVVHGRKYWITKTNGLMPMGSYEFDADGKMINPPKPNDPSEKKNGIVRENGSLYYYKDGKLNYAGLIEINGSYYYVRTSGEVVHGRKYWITKTNGLMPMGSYEFDADGKMINPPKPTDPSEKKDGIVSENGSLYYYKDGKLNYAGLIEINGSYYYVRTSGEVVHGRKYWITKTNGLMPMGSYEFDDDGKMVVNV